MSAKLKIEFGSNGRKLAGWMNTDIDTCDITKPLPFDNESAEFCYTSHTPEHVNCADCMRFFCEVHRILIPNGVFRVIVPALSDKMSQDHVKDLCTGHGHQMVFNWSILHNMLRAAGFTKIKMVSKNKLLDVHDKTIGEAKDDLESLRVEAIK